MYKCEFSLNVISKIMFFFSVSRCLLEKGETHSDHFEAVEVLDSAQRKSSFSGHDAEKTWLVTCNRSEAEDLLDGQPDGTFLIRPSSDPSSFALSIR